MDIESLETEDNPNAECPNIYQGSDEAIDVANKKQQLNETDEYGYTKIARFTSEIYKIEIGNLPKRFGYGECKKIMSKRLQLKPHKINVIPRISKAYVTFKSEAEKLDALKKLNGFVYKGKTLQAKNAKPKADAMALKRPLDKQDNDLEVKRKKEEENISTEDMLKNTVIPWWKKTYAEQLEDKQKAMHESLTELRKRICAIEHLDVQVFRWLMQQKKERGSCCPTNTILPSPIITGYRNKCGFTVGKNMAGDAVVGFRLGKYRDQMCAVESSLCLVHVPEKMKQIADCFTKYVCQSGLQVYNKHTFEGYWKQLMVRSTRDNSVMVTVAMYRQDLSEEQINSQQTAIKDFFKSNDVNIDTLLFQVIQAGAGDTDVVPAKVLEGEGVIFEKLLDLKFRISPDAFFQCNTAAAEVLYTCVKDMVLGNSQNGVEPSKAINTESTILLDVCCGTGTIGLSLAKYVDRVIGVDICDQAIEDANMNAKLNGITNVQFYSGKAEDVLPNLIRKLSSTCSNIVAVVDPPRCGLHNKVIKSLRQCSLIKKLIYVSCSVDQARANFIDLCRPVSKRMLGLAFKPVLAQPLDLFPHTAHCELVLLLERIEVEPVTADQLETEDNIPKTEENPSKTEENPSKTEDNPSKTEENPSKTEDNPSKTEENPPETEDNPSKTEDNPSKTEENPPETEDNPSKTEENPPKTEENPPKTEENPSKTEDNPSKTEENPPETEENPPKTEENPPKTEENPPKTEENPSKTEDNPSKTEDNPSKTEDNPSKKEENPPKTEENPPETEEIPPKAEENPPKTEEIPLKAEENSPKYEENQTVSTNNDTQE